MNKILALLVAGLAGTAGAAEPAPNLPPAEIVARVLAAHPTVQAAGSQIQVEEANRQRLEAGPYEWSIRLGGQQRKAYPSTGPNERFNEWNAAIERPLRLPGKSSLDGELGAAGVALAETARGDARHETSRNLLKSWFVWLKENASATQWSEQVALLEKQSKAVQRRQQLGDAARLEAIQSEAALAQAAAQQAQAQARQRTAGEDLSRRFPGLPLVAPRSIAEPVPIAGDANEWINAILEHNHELGVARGEVQRAQILAGRSGRDRVPDPTFGLHVARERGGEDQIVGAYINIPLPGGARRATANAALAQADVAGRQEAAALQRITAEAAALYHTASAAHASWQSSRSAAERLGQAADLTARAYQLGEGSLNDLLAARRLANEAQLATRLLQLEALELRYRLLLDTHQLWDLDEDTPAGE
ncbi:TolC family protein [Dechloromonas denitrificans]|uniref:TolC family protein n=1 Tax=Dechloromonas denitrificans TaxID=281362 RepID=UPI001CF820BF|nr:TolC family protein [Dechloromonas denitrificans]UCV05000.1 TolC family protein [Dechloromonas denitrificans]